MIYLDYSATTPTNKEVLDTFVKVSNNYIGNPNSLHKLGVESKRLIDASTEQIAKILKVKPSEIIYTSGASESNNTAIKGIIIQLVWIFILGILGYILSKIALKKAIVQGG